ncbi:MAG: hypothetical protein Q8N18_01935 [Opitutaceae bacterium]|nr:hypothetical protein [Opitutaceae bacterium]
MKLLSLFLLAANIAIASDIRAFLWQESRDEKTREPQYGFFVASEAVKEVMEADAAGDSKKVERLSQKVPPDAWLFAVMLKGEAKQYSKEKISIARIDGHESVVIVSGTIEAERAKRVVKIDLKIKSDGKTVSFPGNGTYTVSVLSKK